MKISGWAFLGIFGFSCAQVSPAGIPEQAAEYQVILDRAEAAHKNIPGVYATISAADRSAAWTGASAVSLRRGGASDPAFRAASVTKLFVAVAILRLWEQGRLGLDDPIGDHLDGETNHCLTRVGYDVRSMTVRNLLAHTAGIREAPEYFDAVKANPTKRWTRIEQVEFAASRGGPIAAPGARFAYSDIGYLLAGEILEKVAGQSLPMAVRSLDKLESLGLRSTYFEGLEKALGGVSRVHQVIDGVDVTDFDSSFDPYGASGIVSTTSDLSRFVQALFEGRVFDHQETLLLAMQPTDAKSADGEMATSTLIFERWKAGSLVFLGKKGSYSVIAGYCPELRATIVTTTTDATRDGWAAAQEAYTRLGDALLHRQQRSRQQTEHSSPGFDR